MAAPEPISEVNSFLAWLDSQNPILREEAYALLRDWLRKHANSPLTDFTSEELAGLPGKFGMIGSSPAMEKVFDVLARIIRTDVPILVLGESGTGKELVARALHFNGPRRKGNFMAVNCAAISPSLLESELFGHVKGSFTGAYKDRKGYAVEANGGTLFLDEIGEMAPELQAKLLRFLQDGEVRPVGSNQIITVDARVVAATNRDLQAQVSSGNFREDLYYRLAVLAIELPPLRERRQDIPHLVKFLMARNKQEGLPTTKLSAALLDELSAKDWPGNIRELQNELTRIAAFSD